jgi:hypothetical protein
MNETAAITLVDKIFDAADLGGANANSKDHKDVIWTAAITLFTDVLLRSDEFTRERLLQGLSQELRTAITRVTEIRQDPVNLSWLNNPFPGLH